MFSAETVFGQPVFFAIFGQSILGQSIFGQPIFGESNFGQSIFGQNKCFSCFTIPKGGGPEG